MIRRLLRPVPDPNPPRGRARASQPPSVAEDHARPPRWRRLILSDLFDADFYAALTGEDPAKPARLARHAVRIGMPALSAIHPLLDPRWLPSAIRDAWRTGDIDHVVALLASELGAASAWSPFLDPRVLAERSTETPGDPEGTASRLALGFLKGLGDDDVLPRVTSGKARDVNWREARPRLIAAARAQRASERYVDPTNGEVHWANVVADADSRMSGRVSVIMPTFQDVVMTRRAVRSLLEYKGPEDDLEIIVVDNGSDPDVALALQSDLFDADGVRVLRLARNTNFSGGSNAGLAISSGELALFLNNDTVVRPGWLAPLRAGIEAPEVRGVQPLLLYPDDTIQAAGTVFLARDSFATHLLSGHPRADARGVGDLTFTAITAAAMLVRASEMITLRGFATIFENGMEDVDLCLRAAEEFGGHFSVEPASIVEHHEGRSPGRNAKIPQNRRNFLERWRGRLPAEQSAIYEALGFQVAHLGTGPGVHPAPRAHVVRLPRDARLADGRAVPALRWSLKSAAPSGLEGDCAPASAVVAQLSEGLSALGQEVVEYRAGTHRAPATMLDDVSLVVRGDERVWAHPGKINVLWVGLDVDDVASDELDEFDLLITDSPERVSMLAARTARPVFAVIGDVRRLLDEVLDVRRARPVLQPTWTSPALGDVAERPLRTERACIYTCLLGGYEELTPQPAFAGDGMDRILFTDDPTLRSEHWDVRVIRPALPADPGRSVRRLKILAHEALADYGASLYIDNSVQLKVEPSRLLAELLPAGVRWACVQHSYRGAVEDEAEVVAKMRHLDVAARVAEQIEHYRLIMPEALSAQTLWGGMLARRHTDPLVREVQTIWWEQVLRYSRRDQVSLPYALLAAGLVPTLHRFDNRESDYHLWPVVKGRDPYRALGPRAE